uniref:Uncharacterized protein n=1 Tax=Myotis myotis TaxID=51298 RepID=A0A7J7ZWU8_MYOMY|nr:hypothetical protein mMyoMyo1_009682 [Myotis myotis]
MALVILHMSIESKNMRAGRSHQDHLVQWSANCSSGKLWLASHMRLFGPLSVALPQNTSSSTKYRLLRMGHEVSIALYVHTRTWYFVEEPHGRDQRAACGSYTLLSLNKTCLSGFQDIHPLLACLQGQGAHYHVRQLLTKMRKICFHDFRLPVGPHRGDLLCSKTDLQILTLPPLREKTGLGLTHQAEECRPYVECMPFPVVPEAGMLGLATALAFSSLQ